MRQFTKGWIDFKKERKCLLSIKTERSSEEDIKEARKWNI